MGIGYELRSFASGAPRSSRLYSKISVRIDHLVVSVASLKKKDLPTKTYKNMIISDIWLTSRNSFPTILQHIPTLCRNLGLAVDSATERGFIWVDWIPV